MKRSEIKRRPLADTVLASLEPEQKEYREAYGVDRLYFAVSPSGRKRWDMRYKKPGADTWSWLGLGSYPDVSAKKARVEAVKVLDLLDRGIDPVAEKAAARDAKKQAVANSFRNSAEAWYQKKIDDGRAEKTLVGIRYCLDNDVLPAIGAKPITDVTRADCAKIQASIEKRGAHNTAEKARTWLNQIFGWAIAHGRTENNPASNLRDIAARAPAEKQYPHLMEAELPEFLQALRQSPSRMIALTAAWMVVRTASRPGMVRFAEWNQFDFDAKLWSVPAAIMKMSRDHLVPLPDTVVTDLLELRRLTGRGRYLFPSSGSKCPVISDATINKVFALVGYKGKMTGHGARHTCKTLLSEHGWPDAWSEMQLAHKKVGLREVYDKAAYLEQRRVMMQWYSDYIDALEAGITEEAAAELKARVP
ncbi:integrase arm-type DNA-binding domain-containing protein [Halopseudomonas sp. SMJS2]|uniref:tyrosine-type recombinase/integrase n=1 Tax=Halopseudomonas sp. SMJS2 TaxID=3041098 RepID=UPI0024528BA1|nr:tyrosine-type recombinase/integrase [Halopseudomonas sp. SMJS2]WGK60484.1 integrase arm-type DNA-binding domain-containing protein [Halopseudomonas sp. SMJS2]